MSKKTAQKNRISVFWEHNPFWKVLDKSIDGEGYCYACGARFGKETPFHLEAAHIHPLRNGGTSSYANHHLLCKICHAESEALEGVDYWLWLCLKSHFYDLGSIVPFDTETVNGVEKAFYNESDLEFKFKEHPLPFARLMRYRDGRVPHYVSMWYDLQKDKERLLSSGEEGMDKYVENFFPKTKRDFAEHLCRAVMGELYPKYEEILQFGVAISEDVEKFYNDKYENI